MPLDDGSLPRNAPRAFLKVTGSYISRSNTPSPVVTSTTSPSLSVAQSPARGALNHLLPFAFVSTVANASDGATFFSEVSP